MAARLTTEPGLLGAELLQLSLTVRLGRTALIDLPLWFPVQCRTFLQRLVDEVTAKSGVRDHGAPLEPAKAAAAAIPMLQPLPVRRTQDSHDWISFRAGDDGEVFRALSDDEVMSDEQG